MGRRGPVSEPPGCAGRPSWWDWLCCPRRDLLALHPGARQLLVWQFCFQKADLGENTSFGASFETDHQGCGLSCSQVVQPFLPGEGTVAGSGISLKELGNQAGRHWLHWLLGPSSVGLHPVSVLQVAQTSLSCVSGRVLVLCPSAGGRALSVWGRRGIRGLSPQRREWMRTGGWPVAGRNEDARACPGLGQVSWLSFGSVLCPPGNLQLQILLRSHASSPVQPPAPLPCSVGEKILQC